jgi:hypothetical protein
MNAPRRGIAALIAANGCHRTGGRRPHECTPRLEPAP